MGYAIIFTMLILIMILIYEFIKEDDEICRAILVIMTLCPTGIIIGTIYEMFNR
ncbi:hypothetical protein [Proteus phage vB_PmiP_RS10pmA]|nr:hypothetical protein [Proteus phage vB_PmiP_RS10pmA]